MRRLESLSSLAAVRNCSLSAALAALRKLSFSSSVSIAPGPLLPLYFCFSFFLVWKLFQISCLGQGKPLSDFVPDAAQPLFLLLAARCHPQNQVRDEEGHLAPRSLGWSCCVGFCCLHRCVKGLQSNCCTPAVQSSRVTLDCL